MDKTFSPKGILSEIKKVRWSKLSDTLKNTGQVILFSAVFAAFFMLCDMVAQLLLRLI